MRGRLDPSPARPVATEPAPSGVPGSVLQAARDVFDLRLLGAVIMDLVFDSSVADAQTAGRTQEVDRRGRRLSFDSRPSGVAAQVEVVLDPAGDDLGREMTVQVLPPRCVAVEVRWADGSASFGTSGEGWAVTRIKPRGLLCLVLRSEDQDARVLQTSWVRT